jgi:predicted nucleotidyltransferase
MQKARYNCVPSCREGIHKRRELFMAHHRSKTPYQCDPVVQEFATTLRQQLGSHLRQLLLFGSRARGEAQDGSDYDMLVVVDHRTPELRAVILEVESQLMERYGALVATVLRSETEWQQLQGFPLARNIAREGVPL